MAFSRYSRDNFSASGQGLTVSLAIAEIRLYMRSGALRPTRQIVVTEADRLDTMSGFIYGDAKYWWILAAASDIGWGLQVPPGTLINVLDLLTVEGLLS